MKCENKKIKVAMIGHKRIPGREGGIEVVVEELSKRLCKMGVDLYVYNRNDFKHKKVKKYEDIRIINIPTIPNKHIEAFLYSLLATLHALFMRYDCIHYHAIGPAVMLILPHFFKIRTVVTVHGLNYKTPKWKGFASKYIKLGEKITARYADEIIVLSEGCKEYFLEKYKRETTYIPNGVTIRPFKEANLITKKFDLKKDSYILFLSRIVPGKGLEYLIEAYKQINPNEKLVIAGESSQVAEFNNYIQDISKENEKICFIGFVSGDIMCELYSNCKLFIFPSEAEGMPMCLLEALSFNCNCIVSDISENKEVGKDHVLYFNSKDVGSLKCVMKSALLNNDTVSSRSYIIGNYNWEQISKKTKNLYRIRGDSE